jgi:HEPN domain-containing protein
MSAVAVLGVLGVGCGCRAVRRGRQADRELSRAAAALLGEMLPQLLSGHERCTIPFMVNVAKHIEYWKGGAEEDIAAARSLSEKGHLRHALFFAHLAVEKMLKAHVTKATGKPPPRIHDLLRLAERAGLSPDKERSKFLAYLQDFCLEGRYPDSRPELPPQDKAESVLSNTREVLEWLSNLLK